MVTPTQNIPVFRADHVRVCDGANLGDAMSVSDELLPDDVYELTPDARTGRLAIAMDAGGVLSVAPGTELGQPGALLHLDCTATLMSPDGQITDVLVLVEVDTDQTIAQIYVLPFGTLVEKTGYTLVGIDRSATRRRFAEVACVSFTRGTQITMASGAQIPIEELCVGDRVLTRDAGAQQIRWIGQNTVRATGDFAPIVITAGTLNNSNDLRVSRDHRLFVYQRRDRLGAGQPELLVKARHLVNGESIYVQDGGFVDYFQLLFDRHHIIYAEGIAAESLLITPRTRPVLPDELLTRLSSLLPDHSQGGATALDVQKSLLDRPDAIDLLRRASLR